MQPAGAYCRVTQNLAGGVSAEVRFADSADGPIVIKRALPKLKVAADWFADPARSATEVACLRALAQVLGPGSVPRVVWTDAVHHSFAMERLPDRLVPWKTRLLRCDVQTATARRVGELLGQMHAKTAGRDDLAEDFADISYLMSLRVRPFHHRLAERYPELADAIYDVVDRMLANRQCLVHGDYSPKNLMTDAADVVVLDCEVAHWGDPRFDVAFCLAHLLLKTVHAPSCPDAIAATASTFLDAYSTHGLAIMDAELARATGCLVMARVAGDSPVEYLETAELKSAAFQLGRRLLIDPPSPDRCIQEALKARG